MNARKIFTVVTLMCACVAMYAAGKNFFIKVLDNDTKAELGYYKGKQHRQIILSTVKLSELTSEKIKSVFKIPDDESEILIYLHCWLGNERNFHRHTLNSLNHSFEGEKKKSHYSISVNWPSLVNGYAVNWFMAKERGRKMSSVIKSIASAFSGRLNLLAHSMGNKIFQGMISELQVDSFAKKPFKEIVLASPDLEQEVFKSDFSKVSRLSSRVVVLYHNRDRMLKVGSILTGKKKLGIKGPSEQIPSNIVTVNVSKSKGALHLDPSNHVNFARSPRVRSLLTKVFSHKEFERSL